MSGTVADFPRPGWGMRHPDLDELLKNSAAAAVYDQVWENGLRIRSTAYTAPAELPDPVVTSIRCIVRVGPQIVVCRNRDGIPHPWPGGRREPGETHADTACREVMEETGWTLDPTTLELLGWLHMENLDAQDQDYPLPHPDFLQYVYTAEAAESEEGRDPEWTDTEGYELSSCLMSIDEAFEELSADPLALAFLPVLQRESAQKTPPST